LTEQVTIVQSAPLMVVATRSPVVASLDQSAQSAPVASVGLQMLATLPPAVAAL
jgi:hypothetical protein